MKASELRIGNLIYEEQGPAMARIVGIAENNYVDIFSYEPNNGADFNYECSLDGCSPIPLTEEWLVKFGWKLSTPCQYIKRQHWYNDNNCIEFNYNLSCSIYEGNGHVPVTHIVYVHQLQNLVHSLTGEELKTPSVH